ncbi:2-aminoethanethiol dioxygenase [Musa troglodytarum]|uniref:cysteine dioxygenase n=2 Tax=Musa troglodytarum TaxID=320322 RepID=A0A9E7IMN1_9LILI|nr:2-aminoethanethiol dioxygenase [Musa troglodytarum]
MWNPSPTAHSFPPSVLARRSEFRKRKLGLMPSAVRRLLDTCGEVFADGGAGIVPSSEDVDRIMSILDGIDASDVGLTPDMSYFRRGASRGTPVITYLPIRELEQFSMVIFCLPPSGVIPLHDHPGMTVFTKLLFGSMHIKSYDWVNVPQNLAELVNPLQPTSLPPGLRLAKVKRDAIFTAPCRTSVLYPEDGGNLHCFRARTCCAVLDVLGPPYSSARGRDCTYYHDRPYAWFPGGRGEPGSR